MFPSQYSRTFLDALRLCGIAATWAMLPLTQQSAADEFVVLPKEIVLHGQHAEANVLVQLLVGQTVGPEVTAQAKMQIADPRIATLRDGKVVANGSGKTSLLVTMPGSQQPLSVPIHVHDGEQSPEIQFDAHVQSILARHGCNSGACHGALSGKGGFRLSLRGYDSIADHFAITREDRGRRIEPADPGRSLLLAKPTTLIPHKGGQRLDVGSPDFKLLAGWIADGAPGPQPSDAAIAKIEVLPAAMQLDVQDQQNLVVLAHFEDGRVEDVTHWAKYSSANETVATINEGGRLEVVGNGKGALVVWFASRIALASVSVPYSRDIPAVAYQDFQPANVIDEILLEEWQALGLTPSPACDDATFLRRVYLDATGTLPSADAVYQFLGDTNPDKRNRLVDQVLESEAMVDFWSYNWSDLLLVNGNLLRPDAVAAFYKWIRQQVEQNTPWDEFARKIVLARGESLEQGATNFYAIHQDPESLTENTCQAFMGLSIGCAKCHNHPLEKWTNDQYYAMANLYARVRAKGWGGDTRNGDGKRTLVVLDRGDLIQPSRGQPQPPAPLDAEPIDIASTQDRREALASWLTAPSNDYFSRAIVNRVWANYMGVGLVESVDDLRASNPASSEKLLDALAAYLVDHDFDLRKLMRLILNSEVYRRSSEATPGNAQDERFYCRYFPRRLRAEVLHDAVTSVTGVPTKFTEIEFPGADTKETSFYPEGTRAIELYDSAVANYFLKTFGRHQRRITCDCERSDQPTVVQALHLNNGDTINEKLTDQRCVLLKWTEGELTLERVVEQAYLQALSRFPTAAERSRIIDLVRQADLANVPRQESYEDLLWSLMTSREFLFAH